MQFSLRHKSTVGRHIATQWRYANEIDSSYLLRFTFLSVCCCRLSFFLGRRRQQSASLCIGNCLYDCTSFFQVTRMCVQRIDCVQPSLRTILNDIENVFDIWRLRSECHFNKNGMKFVKQLTCWLVDMKFPRFCFTDLTVQSFNYSTKLHFFFFENCLSTMLNVNCTSWDRF